MSTMLVLAAIIRTAGPYDRFGVARSPGAGQAPTPNLDVLAGLDSNSNTVEHGFSSVERSFAGWASEGRAIVGLFKLD